jgi:hypothetical protein
VANNFIPKGQFMKFMLLGTLIVLGSLMAQAQADDDQNITRLPSASVNVVLSPTVCLPPGPIGGIPSGPVGGCTTVCIPPTPIGQVPPGPIGQCPAFFKNSGREMTITVNGVPYAGVARVFPTGSSALGYSCSDAIVTTLAKNSAGNRALYSELWQCTEWSSGNELLATWSPEAGILVVYPPNPIGG